MIHNTDSYSDKCTVTAVASNKTMDADVMAFHPERNLTVAVNRSVKLLMTWNGRCFEGRAAGMDFESAGPAVIYNARSSRG
jgi:hypothetical protein